MNVQLFNSRGGVESVAHVRDTSDHFRTRCGRDMIAVGGRRRWKEVEQARCRVCCALVALDALAGTLSNREQKRALAHAIALLEGGTYGDTGK